MKKLFPVLLLLCVLPLVAQTTVSTPEGLRDLATQSATSDFEGQTIDLTADIDLAGVTWTPIGTADKPFKGTFRGNGHVIKGLHDFSTLEGVGLFGHVAKGATIEKLGICNSTIVAKPKRKIGAIAGVCAGRIDQCWSSAHIAAAGNTVGGLVGELTADGEMTDCYHSGLIRNTGNVVGGLVGANYGTLTRTYNTGYAENGKALVGEDHNGTYNECYYDRKLYYLQSGVAEENVTVGVDVTETMFSLFNGLAAWSNASDRYPTLSAFGATDAALLSAAPLFIDTLSVNPINHADMLTEDFTVSTAYGVSWSCYYQQHEQWIQITGSNVKVVRPCTETEVLAVASIGEEKRVVYLHPLRLEDFESGLFNGLAPTATFCQDEEDEPLYAYVRTLAAKNGWKEGDYYYCIVRGRINGTDTVFSGLAKDTLFEGNQTAYAAWHNSYLIDTSEPGLFVLRRFAHDEGCVPDWLRSRGEFVYRVFPAFEPGEISDGRDTVYLNPNPYPTTVTSLSPATGGGGPITYEWKVNGSTISGTNTVSLTYNITQAGEYTFTRTARDSAGCCSDKTQAVGAFTRVVFDPFLPGAITEEASLTFCTVEEAKEYTVPATAATGGSKKYEYQWYLVSGTDTTAISGATAQNLPLSLLDIRAGEDYTVVRKAKDNTRFTTLTLSENQTTVHVFTPVKAGAIEGGVLPNNCVAYNATGATMLTIAVKEATAAEGEGELQYRWIRRPDGKVISTDKELDYTFPFSEIQEGNTYTYVREVSIAGCTWVPSDGEATQFYGRASMENVTITVCDEQMPYTMTWIDGSTHTFDYDHLTWLVSDTRGDCPEDTLFTVKVASVPSFYIDEVASLCQSSRTMTLNFEQTAGLSNTFHITYSPDLAAYMGKTDTTGVITIPGTIVIHNMPNIGTGDCYLYLQIGYTEQPEAGVCYSRSHKMTLNVSLGGYVYSKYDRVLFVDNNPDNGALANVTEKLEFTSYQWYRNGIKQEGQTGQYYHEDGRELNGSYYVMLTDTKGVQYRSCDILMPTGSYQKAPQRSTVYPVPVAASQPLTIEGEGSALIRSFAGEIISRIESIDGTITVAAPRATGIYYVQITAPDGTMEMHKLIVK